MVSDNDVFGGVRLSIAASKVCMQFNIVVHGDDVSNGSVSDHI